MKLFKIFIIFGLISNLTGFVFGQDDEVIKIDASVIVMNATITDKAGKSVRNLKKSDFTILEDGKAQTISFFEPEQTPFAAVILIDTSGSMENRVTIARSAAITFLDGLRIDDLTKIYNFDTKVTLVQDFSNSRDIDEKAYDLKADGYTALNDAIFIAADDLAKRPEKRRAIIVLSDGADNKSNKSADKALKAAMKSNVTIYTVDMSGFDTDCKERMQNAGALKNFAEKSGGKYISASAGIALREAFKNIVDELGVQYTLGYQSSTIKHDRKWHTLELKVAKPNLTIRTRTGFQSD